MLKLKLFFLLTPMFVIEIQLMVVVDNDQSDKMNLMALILPNKWQFC